MIALAAGVVLCAPLVFRAQVSIPAREKAGSSAPDDIPAARSARGPHRGSGAGGRERYLQSSGGRPGARRISAFSTTKWSRSITSFSMEDEPVAVGLVFDTSGSMSGAEREERMAATEFFKTANPEDEFALVEFDSSPRLVVPVTPDPAKVTYQLLFTHTKGSTALLDAVFLGLHEIKKSNKKRKALVVISDGGENNSRYTSSEIKRCGEGKRRSHLFDRSLRRSELHRRRRSAEQHLRADRRPHVQDPGHAGCPISRRRSASICATAICWAMCRAIGSAMDAITRWR